MAVAVESVLAEHALFADLPPEPVLLTLPRQGRLQRYAAGAGIYTAGGAADELVIIVGGSLELRQAAQTVALLTGAQDCCGWNAYENAYAFSAFAGSGGCTILRVPAPLFLELLVHDRQLRARLFLCCVPLGAQMFFRRLQLPGFFVEDEAFLTAFKVRFFAPGEVVVEQGEQAEEFFLISVGSASVAIVGADGVAKEVNQLHAGDYFGEVALLEDSIRSATVTATTALAVFSLAKADFAAFLGTRPGRFLRQYFNARINAYTTDVESLLVGSAADCDIVIANDSIAPRHARLTKVRRKDGRNLLVVKPLVAYAQYRTFVNKQPVNKEETVINEHDELCLGSCRIVHDSKRGSISVQQVDYYSLHARNLHLQLRGRTVVDGVSFSASSGELLCILGPSGCGKSTLLEILCGSRSADAGSVDLNHDSLHANGDYFRSKIALVPQDDIIFAELTVFENLYFYAKLREPLASRQRLQQRIDLVLERLDLSARKHCRVGSIEAKNLSGGERKRVSIARELIFDPQILFLDEPTSGLSSQDSLEIVRFLRTLADMGKLVVAVLHQPGSQIFQCFDAVVLMDLGGKLVYSGAALACVRYMKDAVADPTPAKCPTCATCQPESMFAALEQRDARHQRVYSAQFWQERFRRHNPLVPTTIETAQWRSPRVKAPTRQRAGLRENAIQLALLLKRNLLLKVKNRTNMVISLAMPLIIALLLGVILRSSPSPTAEYVFGENHLALEFIFIGVIFCIFVGLTNSVKEIVGEQAIYQLERRVDLRIRWYVLSKFIVLAAVAAVQVALFVVLSHALLAIRAMFWVHTGLFFAAAVVAVALGLLLSALFRSSESVVNWIPLVLIPQIILGGALIKFADMSPLLYLDRTQPIPEICQLVPSRWLYEALVVAQATGNARERALQHSNRQIAAVARELNRLRDAAAADDSVPPSAHLLDQLRAEHRRLRQEKGMIEQRLPAAMHVNAMVAAANLDGDGIYSSHRFEQVHLPAQHCAWWGALYRRRTPAAALTVNMPFYSRNKGVAVGSYYLEMPTWLVNVMVITVMTIASLLLAMIVLRWKSLRASGRA